MYPCLNRDVNQQSPVAAQIHGKLSYQGEVLDWKGLRLWCVGFAVGWVEKSTEHIEEILAVSGRDTEGCCVSKLLLSFFYGFEVIYLILFT